MNLRLARKSLAVAMLCALCSCATIKSNGPWFVPVETYPSGAQVIYRGNNAGTTPCEVRVTRKSSQMTIRKAGYHDQSVDLGRVGNGREVILGTLLFGPFELITAALSGSWTSINASPVALQLTSTGQLAPGIWGR